MPNNNAEGGGKTAHCNAAVDGYKPVNAEYSIKKEVIKMKHNSYREFIDSLKKEYIGKEAIYENRRYHVVDVDYNGMLLIDKKAQFTDTTAVERYMVEVIA